MEIKKVTWEQYCDIVEKKEEALLFAVGDKCECGDLDVKAEDPHKFCETTNHRAVCENCDAAAQFTTMREKTIDKNKNYHLYMTILNVDDTEERYEIVE